MMSTEGMTWYDNPNYPAKPGEKHQIQGMWCPKGWFPSWELGYPIFNVKLPNERKD